MLDLDNWLNGRYRISTPLDPDKENAAEETPRNNEGESD